VFTAFGEPDHALPRAYLSRASGVSVLRSTHSRPQDADPGKDQYKWKHERGGAAPVARHSGTHPSATFIDRGRAHRSCRILVIVTSIPKAVLVFVPLIRIRHVGTVVSAVGYMVLIAVVVASISVTIQVLVSLARVRDQRAVVRQVEDTVIVIVRVTGVPQPVSIVVVLGWIRHIGANVLGVHDHVIVVILVACVAHPIQVGVLLILIRKALAVVTGVACTVTVRVHLVRVVVVGAVVPNIPRPVLIVVILDIDDVIHVLVKQNRAGSSASAPAAGHGGRPATAAGTFIRQTVTVAVVVEFAVSKGGERENESTAEERYYDPPLPSREKGTLRLHDVSSPFRIRK
jgi:hypothetical protein